MRADVCRRGHCEQRKSRKYRFDIAWAFKQAVSYLLGVSQLYIRWNVGHVVHIFCLSWSPDPLRGTREADPEITVVLAIFPPLIFIALVLLGTGTYVLIASIIGFRKLVAEHPNLECAET